MEKKISKQRSKQSKQSKKGRKYCHHHPLAPWKPLDERLAKAAGQPMHKMIWGFGKKKARLHSYFGREAAEGLPS